jgi:galactitol-specific phosphotransferase system IIB component
MKVTNLTFAGGNCAVTMMVAGEKLAELCAKQGLKIQVTYVDLWTSDYLKPNVDLVIEMFSYYKNLKVPIISGRPFLSGRGEKELMEQIISKIREITIQ